MDLISDGLIYVINVKRNEEYSFYNSSGYNRLYRKAVKCTICKINKREFVKKPEEETKSDTKKKLSREDSIIEAKEIHTLIRKTFRKGKIITLG